MTDPNLWCIAAYFSLFVIAVMQSRSLLWALSALSLLLAAGGLALWLAPGVLSPFSLSILYMPQLYIAPAGMLFLFLRSKSLPDRSHYQTACPPLPALLAQTGTAMTLAHWLILLLAFLSYPEGLTPRILPSLLDLYLLQPVYWLAMQMLLMAVFLLHRKISRQPANVFSIRQIQSALLIVMFAQTVYAFSGLFKPLL